MNLDFVGRVAPTMLLVSGASFASPANDHVVVDTGQKKCYGESGEITPPIAGASFRGQDGQYVGTLFAFQDHGNGTVSDLNTGLMWQKTPGAKETWADAVAEVSTFTLGGHSDWRMPTIKELYSLMDFRGVTGFSAASSIPYIDTDYFDFEYGDTSAGERFIDAQYWSRTDYVGAIFNNDLGAFGVNFADGRIKGYPINTGPGGVMTAFVRYVRGNPDYGANDFVDNGDGTVTDLNSGLMWMQTDSGTTLNWEQGLSYAENLVHAGHDDWRMPTAKELQSIVDYTRAPDARNAAQVGPAIDPIFDITSDDSYFWSSTTHVDGPNFWAAYFSFGEAWGWMEQPPGSGHFTLLNVHGAGAQRSDPKAGDPNNWPHGNGPQGDVIRIYSYVRGVRGGVGEALAADAFTASASAGATIDLHLDAGVAHAHQLYLVVGSLSGTSPGITSPDGSITLPLNWDSFTLETLVQANSTSFVNTFGSLGAAGTASAQLVFPALLPIELVGETIYFAFPLLGPLDFASNAIGIDLDS